MWWVRLARSAPLRSQITTPCTEVRERLKLDGRCHGLGDGQRYPTCSMTDFSLRNLVQHACQRPTMFTPNGTLLELYSFFIGFENGFTLMATMAGYKGGHHYYDSVKSTLDWIRSQSDRDSPDGGISSFIAKIWFGGIRDRGDQRIRFETGNQRRITKTSTEARDRTFT